MNVPGMKQQQVLSSLHQVLIYETFVLPQLRKFWDTIWSELADKGPSTISIEGIKMRLPELQDDDTKAKKLRLEQVLLKGWEDIEQVLYYQGLPYIPKVIYLELISRHHDNPLVSHFGIEKTQELIARKYYWSILQWDLKAYVKGCDICLASKAVCHKHYKDF